MFKRVMVATDLSLTSDELVGGLAGLANWGAEEIALAYASDFATREGSSSGAGSRNAVMEDRVQRELDRLEGQKRILEQSGLSVSTHHVIGRPDGVLTKLAESWAANLLILGLRRTSLARNIALGSTAFEILRYSSVPVLLVRPEVGVPDADQREFSGRNDSRRKILFATDFSPAADEAFSTLQELVRDRQHDVALLHVLTRNAEPAPGVSEHLERLGGDIRRAGSEARVVLRLGDPAMEILKACEEYGALLLVMGTNAKGVVGEFFAGSVSQAVARQARLPVLLVRGALERGRGRLLSKWQERRGEGRGWISRQDAAGARPQSEPANVRIA